ncbi:TetR/AcrR family transcriptional regulator [Virgibacillus xinjiangensis]|uniref:TetR/AcrR family transcriptional regulator n=1 Tax=Virgibacillus xinjiangensis TaxID=393090 RepID=A0ABV7CXL2_9BACI
MPKPTFFNLPEEKRQKLVHAAEEEFSRVPLFEASISNIVKAAGIPRGSFYQYFEDKEDIFFFLLNEQAEKRKESLISMLKKYDGDIFKAVTEIYRKFLYELPDEEERNFLKNAFLNVTHKIEDAFTTMFSGTQSNEQIEEIKRLINRDILNISEEKELFYIVQIITAVVFRNFVEKFARELSDDEAMDNFIVEMNLLKRGLHKQNGNG